MTDDIALVSDSRIDLIQYLVVNDLIITVSVGATHHHAQLQTLFSCNENFNDLWVFIGFQKSNTVLLTIVGMLYMTSLGLIYLMVTRNLYLLASVPPILPLATTTPFLCTRQEAERIGECAGVAEHEWGASPGGGSVS